MNPDNNKITSYYLPLDNGEEYHLPFPPNFKFPIITDTSNIQINNTCFSCYKEATKTSKKFFLLTCYPSNPKNSIEILSNENFKNTTSVKITKILNSKEIYFHKNCCEQLKTSPTHINKNLKIFQLDMLDIISNEKISKIAITFSPKNLQFSFNHLNILDVVLEHFKKKKNSHEKTSSITSQITDKDVKQQLHISSDKNILKKFNLLPGENSSIDIDDIFEMLFDNTFSFKIYMNNSNE